MLLHLFNYADRNLYFLFIDQHSMDRFDNTRDMEPTIEMDHLATYSSKSGNASHLVCTQ